MPRRNQRIGSLIQRGVLLFSEFVPFPAAGLVAAVSAAAISKIVGIHEQRVSEILSIELTLNHVPYLEPTDPELLDFFRSNPIYPDLAIEFSEEIRKENTRQLRHWYPFLYNALILKRQVAWLLFHQEIELHQYRHLAEKYEAISTGYQSIQGNVEVNDHINHFAAEFLEVLGEVYGAAEKELKTKDNRLAFELIDYVRELTGI